MSQPLVLDDRCVTDTLVFAEDPVGKQLTFPSHFKRPICEVVDLNVLTCQAIRQSASLQDDLPAIIGQAELLAYMALFTMAQDVGRRGACTLSLRCRSSAFTADSENLSL
jgi:hypothetical protein